MEKIVLVLLHQEFYRSCSAVAFVAWLQIPGASSGNVKMLNAAPSGNG